MRMAHIIEAIQAFSWAFLLIGLLWMGLERTLYGEVQPRVVDDLIAIAWSVMAWEAYFLGRKHGREESGQ